MEGLFTPNLEAEADRVAPRLAQINVVAGLYFWLHSRVFATNNDIGISQAQLAKILEVNPRSVSRAVSSLTEAGLITKDTYRGNGGGSVFHICEFGNGSDLSYLSSNKCDGSDPLNATDSVADATDTSLLIRQKSHTTNNLDKDKGDNSHVYGVYD